MLKYSAFALFLISFSVTADDLILPGQDQGYYSNQGYYQQDSAGGVYTPSGQYVTTTDTGGGTWQDSNGQSYQQDSAGGVYRNTGGYSTRYGDSYYQ